MSNDDTPQLKTFVCYVGVVPLEDGTLEPFEFIRPGPVANRDPDFPKMEANPGEYGFYFYDQLAYKTSEGHWERIGEPSDVSGRYFIDSDVYNRADHALLCPSSPYATDENVTHVATLRRPFGSFLPFDPRVDTVVYKRLTP